MRRDVARASASVARRRRPQAANCGPRSKWFGVAGHRYATAGALAAGAGGWISSWSYGGSFDTSAKNSANDAFLGMLTRPVAPPALLNWG